MATEREAVYDEQVFPLMKRVIELCQEHDITVFATFAIGDERDRTLHCTTHAPGTLQTELTRACFGAHRAYQHGTLVRVAVGSAADEKPS